MKRILQAYNKGKQKRKYFLIWGSVWSMMILSGCGSNSLPENNLDATVDQVSAEEKLYQNYCLNCHGDKLEGEYGPSLRRIGQKYTAEEIINIMEKGIGKMPAQNYIPKSEQQQLAKWLVKRK
ncbi:c-type cytochrome [Thermoflavimicrobium daqui]|jgi:mono/diheme cytochrome c family protein|uniref:Cytochrome C n=1 Tax=Thermoflavimicrobium daqui TaxID=2137476 RepID=A0A364K2F8_9BACL|nr:cytochrome c [Thermoflavimicrobium daqui]RAL22586.1 cytochrome C' [Thermoflavimicrobium daqui]